MNWKHKLRHFLQMLVFCLLVTSVQYAFKPDGSYETPLVYSLAIGLCTWALIDLGRHAFPSSAETGWPRGWLAWGLPAAGIAIGFVLGTFLADLWTGLSTWHSGLSRLRTTMAIALIASLAGCYYFYSRSRSMWFESRLQQAQHQATQAQLQLLQAQLEPHMLFNTLANLRVLIGSDPERARLMLDHLIAFLRATLQGSRTNTIPLGHTLAQEFELLHSYLALMGMRMGQRLSYVLDLPEDLATTAVPPLLLQPLVENSIRHGLEPRVQGGCISVSARRTSAICGPCLELCVADNGQGLEHAQTSPEDGTTGFGTAYLRELLASRYGPAASLELRPGPEDGTLAIIRLPL
ncbi:sensor histidine kinase [Comamonas composti]|uniref:sensor histidine kinase n=1 Tax=Comamonas composti TaxID=408558 RepID=UPI00041FC68E|nr:histidine kinase [Comamonas composti]